MYSGLFTIVLLCFLEKGKTKITKSLTFWKWKHISKTNHILEMKAHSETHFENKNMFWEKLKVINPFLKKLVYKQLGFNIKT